MKPTTAAVIRLVGYLVEIGCLTTWLKIGAEDRPFVPGVSLRNALLGGVLLGMALIFSSHILTKRTVPTRRAPRDLDL